MRKSHQIVFLPGKIAANPRPSTVAGIKRIADAPGWSSPVMLHPRSTPKAAKNYASEARKRKTESVLSPLEKSSILSEKSSLRGEEEEERYLDETKEREERKKKRQLDETMEYGDGKAETAEKQKCSPMKKSPISKKAAVTTAVVPNHKSPISASSAAIKSLDFGENKRFGSRARAAARRANDRISRDCRSLSSEDEDGGGGGNVNLRDRSVEREKQQFLLNFVLCYA